MDHSELFEGVAKSNQPNRNSKREVMPMKGQRKRDAK
jgi:hypothetical protein